MKERKKPRLLLKTQRNFIWIEINAEDCGCEYSNGQYEGGGEGGR